MCEAACVSSGSCASHTLHDLREVPILIHSRYVGHSHGGISWADIRPVCAVASRYYSEKSEIYPIAMHFAKHAAANALITGWKSVELAQAYIVLSIYGVPAKKWEEDRGWLYTGLAIRYVTDEMVLLFLLMRLSTVLPPT